MRAWPASDLTDPADGTHDTRDDGSDCAGVGILPNVVVHDVL